MPGIWWLAAGIVLLAVSVAGYSWFVVTTPGLWGHTDEYVYWAVARYLRHHPATFYDVTYREPTTIPLPFVYPPFAALAFTAFARFSFAVWQSGLFVLNLVLLPVAGYLMMVITGRRGAVAWAGGLAAAAFSIWLLPVSNTIYFGQINLIVLVLCLGDLALKDDSKFKGVGIGLAAALKLTPLIFIPYLLFSRRFRAGVVSLATFAATIVIGWIALPSASLDYWAGKFAQPGDWPERNENQSIYGFLGRTLPSTSLAHSVWLPVALVVGVIGLVLAILASRRGLESLGVGVCSLTALLAAQVAWGHHWVWIIAGLILTIGGVGRAKGAEGGIRGAAGGTRDGALLTGSGSGSGSAGGLTAGSLAFRIIGTAVLVVPFFNWSNVTQVPARLPWVRNVLPPLPFGSVFQEWLLNNSILFAGGAVMFVAAAVYLLLGPGRRPRSITASADGGPRTGAVPVPPELKGSTHG